MIEPSAATLDVGIPESQIEVEKVYKSRAGKAVKKQGKIINKEVDRKVR